MLAGVWSTPYGGSSCGSGYLRASMLMSLLARTRLDMWAKLIFLEFYSGIGSSCSGASKSIFWLASSFSYCNGVILILAILRVIGVLVADWKFAVLRVTMLLFGLIFFVSGDFWGPSSFDSADIDCSDSDSGGLIWSTLRVIRRADDLRSLWSTFLKRACEPILLCRPLKPGAYTEFIAPLLGEKTPDWRIKPSLGS